MRNPKIYVPVGILFLVIIAVLGITRDKKIRIKDSDIRKVDNISEIISSYPSNNSEILGSMNEEIEHIMFFEGKDGAMKAVVPYRVDNSKSPLNLSILEKQGDLWIEKEKLSFIGEDFDKIIFKDISGDGCPEIITGVKMGNTQTKGLIVHGKREGRLVEFFSDSYDELIVEDIIEDESYEVIIGKYSHDGEALNIRAYKQTGGRIRLIDSIDIGNVAEGMSMDVVKVSPSKKAILVQGEIDGNRGYLEALEVGTDSISSIEFFGEKRVMNPFFLEARDIDGDGTIEIPFIKESMGLEKNDKKTWIAEWYSLDKRGDLSVVKKEYVDRRNNFSLEYLGDWYDKDVAIRLIDTDGMEEYVEFSLYQDGLRERIFGIEVYMEEDWSKKSRSYRRDRLILAKSRERVYVVDIEEDTKMAVGQVDLMDARAFDIVEEKSKVEEIKSRFRTLDFGN